MGSKDKGFLYGTHYWRPSSPRRGQHKFNLSKIKNELGFDIIKCRLLWNWHHRSRDAFVFDEVHEIFDICEQVGLVVLLELSLENAPYWLEQEHPEARYVNANGRAVELGSQEATPSGGHPGLCFHHPAVIQEGERYIRRVVNEFKERKSLYIYDCWNEPHLEPAWCNNMWSNAGDRLFCYCDGSRQAFRKWLLKRYGDIEGINRAWGRAYGRLNQVNPPILQGTYSDWLDWGRFWFDELSANMAWRVRIIREEDSSRQVVSHSGAVPPVLPRANAFIHNWKLAGQVDVWGTSFAPQAFMWDLATCAEVIETTRSAAGDREFWISEMPGGAANIRGFRKTRAPRPREYFVWNWLAAAMGSKGTLYWCYMHERAGQESGGTGLVRLDGMDTQRSRAAAETGRLLKKYHGVIKRHCVEPDVAILYDPDNSTALLAMELSDELYGQAHIGYYHAVWECDLSARYITYATLGDLRQKVLIVPLALTMPEEVADKLAEFVHAGGVLIADCRMGMLDGNGFMRAERPAGKLAQAAGLREGEMVYSDPDNTVAIPSADGKLEKERSAVEGMDAVHLGPAIKFDYPVAAQIRARGFITPLELEGAQATGKYDDMVLGAHHRYGQGEIYYFGTYVGLGLYRKDAGAKAIIKAILHKHLQAKVSGERLRPRLMRTEEGTILAVFNDSRSETVTEAIRLPEGFGRAINIETGKTVSVSANSLTLTVGPEDAVVVELK